FYRKNSLTANLSYSQNQTITLPANSGIGDRYLLFVTDSDKYQGETDDNNNVKAVPIKLSAPDLKIVSATAPSTAILSQNINVSWTVKNSGTVNAPANWYDYVYVSNDDKWDTSDLQVGDGSLYIDSQTPLAADGTYTISKNITIPTNAATGNRYLIFYADRNNYQGETDENNNTFVVPITLDAPDLIISEVTAPQTGIVGGQIQVTWKVTNQGTVDAPADWYDQVYLSSNQSLDPYYYDDISLGTESIATQTPLAPDGSYSITKTFTLPNTGNYYNNLPENSYLIFATDQGSQQGETNENNNLKIVPIKLQKPDLVVTDATAPIQADNGSTISVSWTVKNQGTVPANADWYDIVFLSQDNQLGNDTYLNQEYISTQTPLAADGSYTINRSLTLPNSSSFSGDGYLLFVTDYYSYSYYGTPSLQAETNENNNIKAVPITLGVPDLTVASFTAPNTAILGSTVNVAWTVKNQGNVSAKADWYDRIYISDDQTLGGTDTLVTEESISTQTPLAANGIYTISKDVFLPSTATGNRYILLVTDASSNQGETNENNNVKAIPITLTAPDLIVSEVTAPTQAASGGMVDVSWKVTNQGTVEAPADWQDYVYLSDDQNLDYSDTLVTSESIATQTPLAAGESYTINKNITLPNRPSGNYYLLFAADRNDKQGETNNNNNVKAVTISIGIPDLTITNATAPQRASAGEMIALSWTVKNQGTTAASANWYDYVYVSSDQVVDSSDISIIAEYIDSQTPLAADGSYTATRNITLPNNAALVGDRYLIFVTDGNQNQPETSEGNNSLILPINFSASDLTIINATAPNTAVVGSNINVSWTVKNQGNGAANGNWYDYIYLSNDASLDNSDNYITGEYIDSQTPLAADGSYTITRNITLPNNVTFTGDRYLLFVADGSRNQSETNENNNVQAIAINFSASDLTITNATAPSTAVVGSNINVSWTVKNQGNGAANGNWYDYIYVSNDAILDNSDTYITQEYIDSQTPLAADGSYTITRNITLPNNVAFTGDRYLLFVTDGSRNQSETNDNNNAQAVAITLGYPDLIPSITAAPSTAISGTTIPFQWTVKNQGLFKTPENWKDRVYLSRDNNWDNGDLLLGEFSQSGSLTTNESYTGKLNLNLPIEVSGDRYLILVTDATNQVTEPSSESNNITTALLQVQLAPYADLRVFDVTAPSLSVGNPVEVTVGWKVGNIGTGTGTVNNWVDRIVTSEDNVVGNGDDKILKEFTRTGLLGVGESYSRSETITLPVNFQGHYRLFVQTDAKNTIFENNLKANNAASAPNFFDVVTIPYADLVVSSVTPQTTGSSGQPLSLSWVVTNLSSTNGGNGIGPTNSSSWTDTVSLASDSEGKNIIANLGSFDHSGILALGGNYTRTANVTLPNGLQGNYYLVVNTNTGGVFEFIYNDNNRRVSAPVNVSLTPPPDLTVTDIIAPTAMQAGDKIDITWTVKNNGLGNAVGSWTDQLLLQEVGKTNTILLGSFNYNNALEAGKFYTRSEQLTLPSRIQGLYQIVVKTNTSNSLYE
ncbi:MAG: CARDB domain-containing protein, partial [Microcystis panniformis]